METAITTNDYSLKTRFCLFVLKLFLILFALTAAAKYTNQVGVLIGAKARAQIETWKQKITRVEVIKQYIRPEVVPVDKLVSEVAARSGVPAVALRALIDQESSGGVALYRFEPAKYQDLKGTIKVSDSELRMLASSHGVAHVMGFNAMPLCGIHWSKLYDNLIGLECGAKILKKNLARYSKVDEPSQRLWLALRDYNGSGEAAEQYADIVMSRIGRLLYESLGDLN